jgi:hypothetical protein
LLIIEPGYYRKSAPTPAWKTVINHPHDAGVYVLRAISGKQPPVTFQCDGTFYKEIGMDVLRVSCDRRPAAIFYAEIQAGD